MKKTPLLIFAILSALALSACANSNYIECEEISLGKQTYYGEKEDGSYELVCQYRATSDCSSEYQGREGSFVNFFVTLEKNEKVPTFPTDLRINYSSSYDGSHGYQQLEYAKTLGKYHSYRHCYISKDEKIIKYNECNWVPIHAPHDDEAQNQRAYRFDYYEKKIDSTYNAGCIVYFIETTTYEDVIDVNPELTLSYKKLQIKESISFSLQTSIPFSFKYSAVTPIPEISLCEKLPS